jgi:hypothetical protein
MTRGSNKSVRARPPPLALDVEGEELPAAVQDGRREHVAPLRGGSERPVVAVEAVDGLMDAEGTCPARPPGSMPPDGQKRSPSYSGVERTSTRVVPGRPMASGTPATSVKFGECRATESCTHTTDNTNLLHLRFHEA